MFQFTKKAKRRCQELRILNEGIQEHRLSLQSLGLEHYDLFLNSFVTERLDLES